MREHGWSKYGHFICLTMKLCHKPPVCYLCLGSHYRTSHSSPEESRWHWCWPVLCSSLLDSKILASCLLFTLLLKVNCWVFRILWCEGNVMTSVTSLLPRIFYIWGYFSPWVWSIAGRYQMYQLLSCAVPHQVTGSVDQRHSQEFSGNLVTQGEKPCWW